MKGCTPGLLDRLMDERRDLAPAAQAGVERVKDSIARDLEALLNTRLAPAALLAGYPAGAGIAAALRPGRFRGPLPDQQHRPCRHLRQHRSGDQGARAAPVRRRAALEPDAGDVNRLQFAIHACLAPGGQPEASTSTRCCNRRRCTTRSTAPSGPARPRTHLTRRHDGHQPQDADLEAQRHHPRGGHARGRASVSGWASTKSTSSICSWA